MTFLNDLQVLLLDMTCISTGVMVSPVNDFSLSVIDYWLDYYQSIKKSLDVYLLKKIWLLLIQEFSFGIIESMLLMSAHEV